MTLEAWLKQRVFEKGKKGTMHGKESSVEVCNMYQGQTVIVFFASVDSPTPFARAYAQWGCWFTVYFLHYLLLHLCHSATQHNISFPWQLQ